MDGRPGVASEGRLIDTPHLERKINFILSYVPPCPDVNARMYSGQRQQLSELLYTTAYPGIRTQTDDALYKRFQRYLEQDRMPPDYVRALCTLFPVSRDLICERSWDTFEQALRKYHEEYCRLDRLDTLYSAQRDTLRDYIRGYYRDVTNDADFPLVIGPGYLVQTPIVLNSQRPLDEISESERQLLGSSSLALSSDVEQKGALFEIEPYHAFKSRKMVLQDKKAPWNGPCYRLMDISPGESQGLKLSFSRTNYFDYVDTCEARAVELAQVYESRPDQPPASADAKLFPLRGTPCSIFDLSNRAAACGVNTALIVLNRRDSGPARHILYLHKRPATTLEAQNTIHVVPAGTFQPQNDLDGFADRDFSITRNILREFAEECKDLNETGRTVPTSEDFLETEQVKRFLFNVTGAMRRGGAKIYFFGVGFDPITEKPELLTALAINGSKLEQRDRYFAGLKFNYEGKGIEVRWRKEELARWKEEPRMLPAGAACIDCCLKHYDWIMDDMRV